LYIFEKEKHEKIELKMWLGDAVFNYYAYGKPKKIGETLKRIDSCSLDG